MTIDPTHDAGRYVVDRGWSVHVGTVRIARWHRCYVDEAQPSPGAGRAPKRLPIRANAGVIVFSLCTLAVAGILGERVRASQPYSVTLPVPPVVRQVATHHRSRDGEAARHPVPRPRSVVRHQAAAALPSPHGSLDLALGEDEGAEVAAGVAPSRAAAVRIALLSGDMQEWQDASGVRGFVVAGPLEEDDGGRCRALAMLTRSTSGDNVEQRRECLR
ncbi:hypothetical protein [Sphingomonas sp. GV3]|uniref:hypothetical protein n=1 Tax=Sphingomonas sp. GV3 TaxID=3040671 RepID=UPI00280B4C5F|nr:hypothetical protein [Sphingomonas sp. GV3]